jgi:hypothetical protein
MSCGRASIRVLRRKWPSCVACQTGRICPALCAVVRKLNIWNCRPPAPMRVRRSKTGPALSNLIATAVISINGNVSASRTQAIKQSPERLICPVKLWHKNRPARWREGRSPSGRKPKQAVRSPNNLRLIWTRLWVLTNSEFWFSICADPIHDDVILSVETAKP